MTNPKNRRNIVFIFLLTLVLFSGCQHDPDPTPYYTVSVASGISNGKISVSHTSAKAGQSITVTATPDSGYQLQSGSLTYNDGTEHAITGTTFTMPAANVTVSAAFVPDGATQYTITVTQPTGGTILPSSSTASSGQQITLTVTPASGKKLVTGSLKFNDTSIPVSGNIGTFAMPAGNVTITAEFEDLATDEYSIEVSSPIEGGSIAIPSTGISGGTITVTVTPASGYQLQSGSLKYNDGTDHTITGNAFTMPAANVTVSAAFEKIPYTVTASTVTGGTIAIAGGATPHYIGDTITLTVTPASGYQLQSGSLTYNDTVISGPPYTFTMPAANVTVSAAFEKIPYTVTASTVTGGTIEIAGGATPHYIGDTITVTVTPNPGYQPQSGSLKYNDGTNDTLIVTGGPTAYTFTMPAANVTVSAAFVPDGTTQYTITVTQPTGGTILPSSSAASSGQQITLTVTPNPGYQLQSGSLTYNDTVISGPPYTFTMPAANVTVNAVFAKIPYTVTASTVTGGTIEIAGGATPHYIGDTITLTVTPASGYQLQSGSLTYNDTVISGPPYTFTMPAANVTVSAAFYVPVTGVSVTPSVATLAPDTSLPLTAAITPLNAANTAVTWESSNSYVASVSGSGLTATVTAHTDGTATITATATTVDGSFTDTCVVTVTAGSGFIFEFDGFEDESIDLTLDTEHDLSRSDYDTLTVDYTGTGTVTGWYLDGEWFDYESSITISAYDIISLGTHYLSVVVSYSVDSVTAYASKEISFRIVE
jgi:hypothetical protein